MFHFSLFTFYFSLFTFYFLFGGFMKIYKSLLLLVVLSLFVPPLSSQNIPRSFYVLNGLGQTVSRMNLESGAIKNNISTVDADLLPTVCGGLWQSMAVCRD